MEQPSLIKKDSDTSHTNPGRIVKKRMIGVEKDIDDNPILGHCY